MCTYKQTFKNKKKNLIQFYTKYFSFIWPKAIFSCLLAHIQFSKFLNVCYSTETSRKTKTNIKKERKEKHEIKLSQFNNLL